MAKSVRFDYFKVYSMGLNEAQDVMEERLCELSAVIQDARAIPVNERILNVGDDQARLQEITFNNDKWELHFLRIKKNNFPLRVHDNGTVAYFNDLGDDEGFGEEVSAIYDPALHVIMIRRNGLSLSPTAIASFFTNLINRPGFTVLFKPMIHPSSLELLDRDHLIRSAEISIADVKNAQPTTKRSLGRLVRNVEELNESVSISLKISIEQKGSKKHSKLPIFEEIEGFAMDDNVKAAVVRVKEDEDSRVERFDLIQNRLVDYNTFSDEDINEESRNILHSTVLSAMHRLYRSRVNDIHNIYV